MIIPFHEKKALLCEVLRSQWLNKEIFRLDIAWPGPPPRAGQFFLVRPERTGCFLSRPLSAAFTEPAAADTSENRRRFRGKSYETVEYNITDSIAFMIALRGRGTGELAGLRFGDKVELMGPLGNAWTDFLPLNKKGKKIALIGGGIGIAPLIALALELEENSFDFYAGFKTLSTKPKSYEYEHLLGPVLLRAGEIILATEDGSQGNKGFIPAFLDPGKYGAVCACGPEPMLRTVAAKCGAAGVPCFVSMEKRMACGVGACLGCTVKTTNGNKRCCADGPIFPGEDILFDEPPKTNFKNESSQTRRQ
jgi:NAD(P)H-flavin reductase